MRILLTISFLLILITLAINLYLHIKKWKQGKGVKHKASGYYRSIGFIAAGVCLLFTADTWLWRFLITASGLFFYLCFYWLAFDGLYNKLRKYPFWQIGTIDKDEAGTDNFLRTISLTQHKILKIGLVVISFILFIVLILNEKPGLS